ncbi:MAG: class GN sortase [Candidatus Thiodiazotropha sp.]|nr:class GN sortase [Candidatus Thiodiazotropha sp.]MCM8881986.1 class GN sortase [Candidatus Thiodiazotropha sp.]MCM8918935.1 class GN sortase [Candidatus Thiodiazotropha sp.]
MTSAYINGTPSKQRGNFRYFGPNRVVQILRSKAPQMLFLIACWFLGEGVWIEAKAWLAEGLIAAAWNETHSGTDSVRPWPWADTWPVAVLQVPRLDVERFVLSGVSGRVLAFGPGWAEQTIRPGKIGPSLIAGHRDTHFRFLKELQQGDRVVVRTPGDGQVAYRVTEKAILDQQQSWLMSKEGAQALILVTCYPFDALLPGGNLRYVVRAEAEDSIGDDTDLPVW